MYIYLMIEEIKINCHMFLIVIVMKISNQLRVQLNQVYLKQSHKFTIKLLVIIICIQNPKQYHKVLY